MDSLRQPGMTREDLIGKNAEIVIAQVGAGIRDHAPDSVVIVVTNPLTMTYHMQKVKQVSQRTESLVKQVFWTVPEWHTSSLLN